MKIYLPINSFEWFNIILSALRKAARQRSGQRERMMCPEAMPLARGLGMA
jgi:hypothetical protein